MAGRFSVSGRFSLVDRMSRPIGKIEGRLLRFSRRGTRALQGLDRRFEKLGRTTRVAQIGMAAAAAGTALAVRGVVSAGMDFEQAITNVGAVGLQTRDQIALLEKQALALGSSTKFTATEVANAMEIMAKAGFSTADIMAGVPGVLDAAAASGLEMAEVADVVSNSLKGMGLETSQAGMVADVLALASSKTNSTIGTLGESMRNVASTARQLGVPFHEAVASVALLQDVGLDASVAGSSLNTMLTKLAKPPAELARKMDKMGISFKDSHGNMLPLAKVIEQISIGSKKMGGNFNQVEFLADLVGLRGQKAAANLAKLFEGGKLAKLTGELENASGSAAKMAAIRMDTLEGDWTKLGSAVEGVQVALFDLKGGAMRGVIQGMTEWVAANKELIVGKVSGFIKTIQENAHGLSKTLSLLGNALVVFYSIAVATKVATAAMWLFNAAVTANPIGLLIVAVAALGTVVYTFWDEIVIGYKIAWKAIMGAWEPIKQWFAAVGEFILGVYSFAFPHIVALAKFAVGAIKAIWGPMTEFFTSMWDDWLAPAVQWVGDIITMVIDPIQKAFSDLWAAVADVFHSTLGAVFGAITSAVDSMRSLGRATMGGDGGGSSPAPTPQTVSPQERMSREVSESLSESRESIDLTIHDESGRAQMSRKPKRANVKLMSSGAF